MERNRNAKFVNNLHRKATRKPKENWTIYKSIMSLYHGMVIPSLLFLIHHDFVSLNKKVENKFSKWSHDRLTHKRMYKAKSEKVKYIAKTFNYKVPLKCNNVGNYFRTRVSQQLVVLTINIS